MARITTVSVLGAGVLGSQIAFQAAYHGFEVTSYDISDKAVQAADSRLKAIMQAVRAQLPGATDEEITAARGRITHTTELAEAAKADLVIEAVPENLELKQGVYTELGGLAPESTIFATNSSTLLPSDIAASTGRPDRFLALHFANQVWIRNTAEVMGTEQTDPAVYDAVVEFAGAIGMVPIQLHKEQPGYVLNSLLVPLLGAAAELLMRGVATPEDIDNTWRIATGAPNGPFEIYDVVGLRTPYEINKAGDEGNRLFAQYLKENYLDKGKLGMESGEGFYKYDERGKRI